MIMPRAVNVEGPCRAFVHLRMPLEAAYLEGRGKGAVLLRMLPKAAYLEGRCQGLVPFKVFTKESGVQRFVHLGFKFAMLFRGAVFTFGT